MSGTFLGLQEMAPDTFFSRTNRHLSSARNKLKFMEDVNLDKFYKDIIQGWIMGDLKGVKNIGANLLTALSCFIYTEIIGIFLPPLNTDIEGGFSRDGQRHFYRCLFRLESGESLKKYDEKLRKVEKNFVYHQNGIYHLRNQATHKYFPIVRNEAGFIEPIIQGAHNNPRLPVPIFIVEDNGKISHIVINNIKYIEELEKLVDDMYDKIFNKKEKLFVDAMVSGYNKIIAPTLKERNQQTQRNPKVALYELIKESKKSFIELCNITKVEKNYGDKIKKGEFPKLVLALNLEKEIPQEISWVVIRNALKCSLVNLVAEMFDSHNKGVISFKTVKWFTENPEAKKELDLIHGEKIIGKMIDSRHTFFSHMGDETNKIISGQEICESNLPSLLERLENLYLNYSTEKTKKFVIF